MFVVTLPASVDPATFARQAANAGADMLEIRTDRTPSVEPFASPLPLLVSLRGGGSDLIDTLHPHCVDIEGTDGINLPEGTLLIRSFHDHAATPTLKELTAIATTLQESGADMVKIATTVHSYADVATLDSLHAAIPAAQKRVILGMGVRAHITRMLSPLRNALTYTFLEEGQEAAPGQVPLHLHQRTTHCRTPRLYGILGSTDIRSASPLIQNTFFEELGFDGIFTTFLTDDLRDAWEYIVASDVQGCAVTSPWKQDIIPLLDRLEPEAERIGSVNTIRKEDGEWVGYMRDTQGMMEGYPFLKEAQSAAILGSGGVVPAVIATCQRSGIEDIRVFARNAQDREVLKAAWNIPVAEIEAMADLQPDILFCAVNADVSFPLADAKAGAHAIDLRYGKTTRFLEDAAKKGYGVHDGAPMLIRQAAAQCELFTGTRPSETTLQSLLHSLSSHGR